MDFLSKVVGLVAYFTSGGYFAVVVNFRLPSVEHLDYIAGVGLPIIVNVVPTPKTIRDNLFIPRKASDFCVLIS